MKIRRGIWCGRVGGHDVGLYTFEKRIKKCTIYIHVRRHVIATNLNTVRPRYIR